MFPIFAGYLERQPDGVLLDVGPVCGDNISFFAVRVKKLYIQDLFRQLKSNGPEDPSDRDPWRDLIYPRNTFDADQIRYYINDHQKQLKPTHPEYSYNRRPWRDFTYPRETFDAVQIWNLGDYLDDRQFISFIERCAVMIKPRGQLMMVAASEEQNSTTASFYVVKEEALLQERSLSYQLPSIRHRHNRDIIDLMSPLRLVKSSIYKNGSREFLFEHP